MSNQIGNCVVCQTPAKLRCSACHKVPYCGKQHQLEDWRNHKKYCCVYEVKLVPYCGVSVVATRNIKKGQVIIVSETPLVIGPSNVNADPASCPGCLRIISFHAPEALCPRCKWPVCNEVCPGLSDPAYHAAECEILATIKSKMPIHLFEVLLPLRCLLLQKTYPEKWAKFKQMAAFVNTLPIERGKDDIMTKESKIFLEDAILKPLANAAPHLLPKDRSSETLSEIFNLLESYGVAPRLPKTGWLIGVCEVASFMEHSCVPNTLQFFEAPTDWANDLWRNLRCGVTIRAARDIKKGEHLTSIFTEVTMSTCYRQLHLTTSRGSRCSCIRCSDPTELGCHTGTLKCLKCSGWVMPIHPIKFERSKWRCNGKCGRTITAEAALAVANYHGDEVAKLSHMEDVTSAHLEKLLKKFESALHPHHQFCLQLKSELIKFYCVDGDPYNVATLSDRALERKAELCRDVLDAVLKPHMRVPSNSCAVNCLFSLAHTLQQISKRKMCSSNDYDLSHLDQVKKECSELFDLAGEIGYGSREFVDRPVIKF